jgi:hypothetical protein
LRALRWYVHPGQPASAPVRFAGGREPTLHLNGSHARLRRRAGAWRGLTVYSSAAPYWPVAAARRARPSSGLGPVEQARHSFGKRSRRPCAGDDGSARRQISWLSTSKLTSGPPSTPSMSGRRALHRAPPAWSHHVPDVDARPTTRGFRANRSSTICVARWPITNSRSTVCARSPAPPCNQAAQPSARVDVLGVQRGYRTTGSAGGGAAGNRALHAQLSNHAMVQRLLAKDPGESVTIIFIAACAIDDWASGRIVAF